MKSAIAIVVSYALLSLFATDGRRMRWFEMV